MGDVQQAACTRLTWALRQNAATIKSETEIKPFVRWGDWPDNPRPGQSL